MAAALLAGLGSISPLASWVAELAPSGLACDIHAK